MHGLVAALADEPGGAAYTQLAAINRCASKIENGYSDWFLPNKAQATVLFNNRFAINPNDFNGGFPDTTSTSIYWSSSPVTGSTSDGWRQLFSTGEQSNNLVSLTFSARCVRAF